MVTFMITITRRYLAQICAVADIANTVCISKTGGKASKILFIYLMPS